MNKDDKDLNVLIINDLCSYGKASLTVNIPVLSAFKIKVSPLISVLLSNHTAFNSFCAFDLTKELEAIIKELKLRKPKFDAFYIGWLSAGKQPEIVIDIIKDFNFQIVLLDPILGDNGKLYPSMSNEHVKSMKSLLKYSTIATPNITELAVLLDKDPSKKYNEKEIEEMAKTLSEMGPKTVIVTSVEKENKLGCLCYNENKIITKYYDKINISMPGTGDAFGASLLGYILKGETIENALNKATKFIYSSVKASFEEIKSDEERIYGIAIEKRLNLL